MELLSQLKNIRQCLTLFPSESYNRDDELAIIQKMKEKEFKLKEKLVLNIHKNRISASTKLKNGKPYDFFLTWCNGKSIRCAKYESVIEKLFDIYFPGESEKKTIEKYYNEWRKTYELKTEQGHRSIGSLRRYDAIWHKYYKNAGFIKKTIEKVNPPEIKAFYAQITSDYNLSRKELNNVKSLLNLVSDYMSGQGIKNASFRSVSTRDLMCRDVCTHNKVYTDEDRKKIIAESYNEKNSVYGEAIRLHFNLCCRIGEIKALNWSDIDFDHRTLYIHAEMVEKAVEGKIQAVRVEHTKSKKESGNRLVELNDAAYKVLKSRYQKHPFDEYVFMYDGKPLTTDEYNKVLKRICKRAKVRYFSSHKIRFWAVTKMAENHMTMEEIKRAAGHSDIKMTEHYIRHCKSSAVKMNLD